MEEAQDAFARGQLDGVAIHFHGIQFNVEECWFTVIIDAGSASGGGSGPLVAGRDRTASVFQTMSAAHAAIRKIGFQADRLWTGYARESATSAARAGPGACASW
ncbi:hypothetical protein [Rugamonas apoptosis]|uniref:Uncharacterized protein n=1 Tax=Rugamonas apoptosis TaxID=2758570 RepID=A0A7W2FF36_9BURK|nr:hypothetical protein [Rugamonas apoptosis]MBA5690464.1 hypothetical protein [Rugamonas apoptosis]